jgi:hypothetical protein
MELLSQSSQFLRLQARSRWSHHSCSISRASSVPRSWESLPARPSDKPALLGHTIKRNSPQQLQAPSRKKAKLSRIPYPAMSLELNSHER